MTMKVSIEIENAGEEQQLQGKGLVKVGWLHRSSYASDGRHQLVDRVKAALETVGNDTFVWFAAEKADVRTIKRDLAGRKRDRKRQYVAWYWEKDE